MYLQTNLLFIGRFIDLRPRYAALIFPLLDVS